MAIDAASINGLLARLDDVGMRAARIAAADEGALATLPADARTLFGDAQIAVDQLRQLPGDTSFVNPLADALAGAEALGDVPAMQSAARSIRTVVPEVRASVLDAHVANAVADDVAWLRAMVARTPEQMSTNDWRRVRELVSPENAPKFGLDRSLPGIRDLDDLLAELVTDATPGPNSRAYLAHWRVQLGGADRDPERARTMLRDLLDRDLDQMTNVDWAQVRALFAAYPDGGLDVSRSIPGLRKLDELLADLIESTTPGPNIRTYRAAWRMELDGVFDDVERRRAVLRELVARPTDSMTFDDWSHVRALVAGRDPAELGISTSLPAVRELDDLLVALLDDTRSGPNMRTFLGAWRAQLGGLVDDPEQGRAALLQTIHNGPESLSLDDWGAVRGLLAADPENRLGVAREVAGARPLDELLAQLAETGDPGPNAAKYVASWLDELSMSLAERRAAVTTALGGGAIAPALRLRHLELLGDELASADPARRRLVELQLLTRETPDSIASATAFIDRARRLEPALEAGSALEGRWQAAMNLLDLNADRLAGIHRDGAVRGYANHPDYAELGRARAHIEFVARALSADGVPAPVAAVDSATAGAEQLTW